MHKQHPSIDPTACGDPDPCGLAPAALAPIDPMVMDSIPEGRRSAVRIRAGLVRQGRGMRHLASEVGQGTVEYVGLLLLMATLLAAIVGGAKSMGGDKKIGQRMRSVNLVGGTETEVEIISPHMFDPEGERLRG